MLLMMKSAVARSLSACERAAGRIGSTFGGGGSSSAGGMYSSPEAASDSGTGDETVSGAATGDAAAVVASAADAGLGIPSFSGGVSDFPRRWRLMVSFRPSLPWGLGANSASAGNQSLGSDMPSFRLV